MTTVQEPSRELRRLATRIDYGLGRYLAERGSWALTSEWEAPRYGWSLSNLALRHAEATLTLARTDMVLAPSAWVTARAATEAAARCLWLLQPEDEWEREARWLALLHEGVRLGDRKETKDVPTLAAQSKRMKEFAEAVAAKLPEGMAVPGMDSIQSILAAEGEGLALFYVMASQYTHATEHATRFWRVNLGIDASHGEFVGAKDWLQPLWMSYLSFRVTALRLIELKGEDPSAVLGLADHQAGEARDAFVASIYAQATT
ncbi:hypothetical protein E2F48_11515 [Arthrobacter crusticola]|uniref:Uncharacterized protein n=1 Tax=Arthrobacter crusticola TaxID=2547960 RepID=A0A4R5TXE2_9MICC|nr:hypothetical protein [Arthrobacter crusticola]TDK25843.1 hypothetical protein E2F48_11515 [Arthrobacter crusticola]